MTQLPLGLYGCLNFFVSPVPLPGQFSFPLCHYCSSKPGQTILILLTRLVWLASTSIDRSYSSARTRTGRRETPHRDRASQLRPPRSKPRAHPSTPQPEREPLFGVVTLTPGPRQGTWSTSRARVASSPPSAPADRATTCEPPQLAPAGGPRPRRQPAPTARLHCTARVSSTARCQHCYLCFFQRVP